MGVVSTLAKVSFLRLGLLLLASVLMGIVLLGFQSENALFSSPPFSVPVQEPFAECRTDVWSDQHFASIGGLPLDNLDASTYWKQNRFFRPTASNYHLPERDPAKGLGEGMCFNNSQVIDAAPIESMPAAKTAEPTSPTCVIFAVQTRKRI